jgi:hypothetical protein
MDGEQHELEETKRKPAWGKTVKVSLGVLGGLSLLMGYISAAGMQESERRLLCFVQCAQSGSSQDHIALSAHPNFGQWDQDLLRP